MTKHEAYLPTAQELQEEAELQAMQEAQWRYEDEQLQRHKDKEEN